MRNKKQTVFMGHMFSFHAIFVAGANQKTIEILFLAAVSCRFLWGFYIHWGVINEDGEALHCDGRCPLDLKGVSRGSRSWKPGQ